jgi:xanthine dehydrogenase accessory factor
VLCVGGGEVVDALVDLGRALGWLVEPRADGADAVEAAASLGPADALVVTTHDPRWGPEALAAGLTGRAFYVGALGSRRTQARRATALAERGLEEAVIAAVHGPIGLDLGSRSPAETALAICAEVLAVRSGRELPGLRDRAGAINS